MIENVSNNYNKEIGLNNKSKKNKTDLELKRKLKGNNLSLKIIERFLSNFANQTLQLNEMRKGLEEDFAHKKKIMQKAYMENNRTFVQTFLLNKN